MEKICPDDADPAIAKSSLSRSRYPAGFQLDKRSPDLSQAYKKNNSGSNIEISICLYLFGLCGPG